MEVKGAYFSQKRQQNMGVIKEMDDEDGMGGNGNMQDDGGMM